ncbi:MAG: NAD(P)-dependent oxidoreductase [Geminicoccaceae bacterium]|nr:NAD(P)-dependent oxidoreductase [Geminicoccaceae bacterium]
MTENRREVPFAPSIGDRTDGVYASGIRAGRLDPVTLASNFADLHPPFDDHEARVEADRCYFCFDAPCMQACPTRIDIPLFIRQIATGNPIGSARTIFEQNILGGMCARVCPVETLCEEACVRETAEGKPVQIGRLQRHATDAAFALESHPFERAAPTGKRAAVVGAGPAGLSCAHRLAVLGHAVTLFEARDKSGGLNEYGIAAYKTPDDFAQREVAFVLSIGGIELKAGCRLGRDVTLSDLRRDFDAVFLGLGLGAVAALGLEGEELEGVVDAVRWIAELRQTRDLSTMPVGRRVVVVGGGMTAIDAAVQSRLLGAEDVTMVYRRGPERMNASLYEQNLAQTRGVRIRHHARPVRALGGDRLRAVEFARTTERDGHLVDTGETFELEADMLMKATGQSFEVDRDADEPLMEQGRIRVDADRRTDLADVWAGGDCVSGGQDLTVVAVEDGKIAARSIHRHLQGA